VHSFWRIQSLFIATAWKRTTIIISNLPYTTEEKKVRKNRNDMSVSKQWLNSRLGNYHFNIQICTSGHTYRFSSWQSWYSHSLHAEDLGSDGNEFWFIILMALKGPALTLHSSLKASSLIEVTCTTSLIGS